MRNSKLTLHIFSDMIFCQQSIESFPLKFLKRIFFNLPILILTTFLLLSRTSWANKRKENPKKLQKSKNRCSFHLTVSVRFFFFPANLWMKIFLTTVLFRFFMLHKKNSFYCFISRDKTTEQHSIFNSQIFTFFRQ